MIFKKKQLKELPPLLSQSEIDGASYEQVIDFLTSVNDGDFDKIIKVAGLYRKTHCDVADITGQKQEPVASIFDTQTIAPHIVGTPNAKTPDTEAGDFMADDELKNAFLDDEPKTAEPTKIDVKTDQGS